MFLLITPTANDQQILKAIGPALALRDDMVNGCREETPIALAGAPSFVCFGISRLKGGDPLNALHIHHEAATRAGRRPDGMQSSDELETSCALWVFQCAVSFRVSGGDMPRHICLKRRASKDHSRP